MPDWPSALAGSRFARLGADLAVTAGANITAAGSANTKGSYIQIVAATPFDADGFFLLLTDASVADFLVDVAIGAAGSEVNVLDNVPYHSRTENVGIHYAYIPLPITAGSRIAMRCQASAASGTVRGMVDLLAGSFFSSMRLGRATTYGAATADSGGVSIDPGATVHTKGAYSQIVAATTNPIAAALVCIGGQTNAARINARWLLDLAIGAGGSEVVVLDNLEVRCHSVVDVLEPQSFPLMPIAVKAGARLAARAQSSVTDATNRLFDVVVIGFD